MGALECPAVGSSVFNSPFVELITCRETRTAAKDSNTRASEQWLQGGGRFDPGGSLRLFFFQNSAVFLRLSLCMGIVKDSAHSAFYKCASNVTREGKWCLDVC